MPIQSGRVSAIKRIVADIRVSVKRLRVFRMTGQRIGRQNLPTLDELYLARRKIYSISGIDHSHRPSLEF